MGKLRDRLTHLSLIERLFERRKVQPSGCWEFTGAKTPMGYGNIRYKGKIYYTHRMSYQYHFGPTGKFHVLHKCDNPCCFNPEHLFLGTHQDNMVDMTKKGRNKGLEKMNSTHSRWK